MRYTFFGNKPSVTKTANKQVETEEAKVTGNNCCRISVGLVANKIYSVYLNDDIGDAYHYVELFNILRSADKGDEIHLYINNGGGYLHTVYQFISALRQTNATVIGFLDGVAYSGASMIFLACGTCAVPKQCCMMIHWYEGGVFGKGNENKKRVDFEDDFIKDFYRDIYKDFLTTDELERVFRGEDYWFDAKEIHKRLAKKYKKLNKDYKAMEAKVISELKNKEKAKKAVIKKEMRKHASTHEV